jgi:hypothetical protein
MTNPAPDSPGAGFLFVRDPGTIVGSTDTAAEETVRRTIGLRHGFGAAGGHPRFLEEGGATDPLFRSETKPAARTT